MKNNWQQVFHLLKERWIKDIRFWILLFFLIRMVGITNPPLEMGHNWRQTFTNSVARTYYEQGNSFFYPQADIYGEKTGVVGTEFPLLNYLISIFASILGYAHWYGRLINLAVSSIGIWFFYKLVRDHLKPELAFNATLILLSSIWFAHARKSMPDTFSVSITLIGLYYGFQYLAKAGFVNALLFFLFGTLGILCKIPCLFFLAALMLPFFRSGIEWKQKFVFLFALMAILYLVSFWYFMWVPYLESMYGNRLYFPQPLLEGLHMVMDLWPQTLEKFYFAALESYVAFGLFLAGLFFIVRKKEWKLLFFFLSLTIVFFLFMAKTGQVFSIHSYYVVPFVPVMAIVAANGLMGVPGMKLRTVLLVLIVAEGMLNQNNDFFIKKSECYKLELEKIADKVSSKDDLIGISGGESPQQLYFAHRKGWRIENEDLGHYKFIENLKKSGCKYLFLNKQDLDHLPAEIVSRKVFEDDHYIVYAL